MYKLAEKDETKSSLQQIVNWSKAKYRYRTFQSDRQIPTRAKILYLVHQGAVKLTAKSKFSVVSHLEEDKNNLDQPQESFLSFVGEGQPFEIVDDAKFEINAYAHIDETSVLWMYWHELDNWPNFRREVFAFFRDRQQRNLLAIATLNQRNTIDRLYGFLSLMISEHGVAYTKKSQPDRVNGYYLPWAITHAEIASAIGSTRVTVTRLLGELREQGLIDMYKSNYFCLPPKNP
jgi:CRP-like cAMP-binding protein